LHLALTQAKGKPRSGITYELPKPSPSPKQSALRASSLTHAGSYRPVSAYSHARFNAIGLPSWESLPAWERDVGSDEWLTPDQGNPAARIGGHPIDRLVNLGLDNATADGKHGRYSTGVRAWHAFVEDNLGLSPARPMETYAPLYARLQEELLAMRFVLCPPAPLLRLEVGFVLPPYLFSHPPAHRARSGRETPDRGRM